MNIKQTLQFKYKENQYRGFSLFGLWPTYMVFSGTILLLVPFTGIFIAIILALVPFTLFLMNANFTNVEQRYINSETYDMIMKYTKLTEDEKEQLIEEFSYFLPKKRDGWLYQTIDIKLPTINIMAPKLHLPKKAFKKLRPATTSN